jgi:ribosomal protein S18 acetylase RimI-like enzyme
MLTIVMQLLLMIVTIHQMDGVSGWILLSHRRSVSLCRAAQQSAVGETETPYFRIRDCRHAELGACVDIIMESFYNTTTQAPWKQMYRLGELNRLQQGFPYGDDRALHRMILAEVDDSKTTTTTIVGYVDIDLRPPNRPTGYSYNPRPYLSDLCIRSDYRRNGIAKGLVQFCEQFVLQSKYCDNELFIRVEAHNTPAIAMYKSLGYQIIHNPDDPQQTKIWILHRLLDLEPTNKEDHTGHVRQSAELYNTTTIVSRC